MSQSECISVEVAYATPSEQTLRALQVPTGTTVGDLLQQVSQQAPFSELDLATHQVGIFGQVCDGARVLLEGDRLEIYRPLLMDAKAARLARAQKHREKQKQR
ncbi:MAG: RnfH family protein [Pseudomonadales bacterium]|jgi:putative ubiquitin-RnfH superfamily antitoxin RatB of RatAB toxin-antitoxin module|nr:RnfH family protein [Pseudomonadales bacterium]